MKKKRFAAFVSAALLALSFAGCSTETSVSFTFYWNPNANNELLIGTNESYEYDVYLKPESGENSSYSVDYQNGKYTTSLTVDEENPDCYLLETSLTISVRYSYGGETSDWFEDSVVTKARFKGTNSLQPVYSEKTVRSTSPLSASPNSLAGCYASFHYTVTTAYNEKATSATCERKDLADPKTSGDFKTSFSVPGKHTYLDNEQLVLALRAIDSQSQQSVYCYNAASRGVQTLKVSKDKQESGTYRFRFNGEDLADAPIDYIPVSLSISSDNPGGTQLFHVAKAGSKYRCAILRMETPIAYQLGTLVYELKKATTFNA